MVLRKWPPAVVPGRIVGFLLLAAAASTAVADDPCPAELEWWTGPYVSAATVSGGRVVAVDRSAGLRVFASTADDPLEEVGLLPELETAEELAAAGDLVVVVTGNFLYVVDISDPSNPRSVGKRISGRPTQVAMSGSYAFSHDSTTDVERLIVVDLHDPAEPTIAAELPLADIDGNAMVFLSDLAVHESLLLAVGETGPDACYLYGDYWEGEYELTDPLHPSHVGSVSRSGLALGPAVEGDRAFVPFGPSGLAALGLDACPAAGPPAPRHPSRRLRVPDHPPRVD